ncbi:WhiB family transcriptional regulator [Mycobacterium sp. SVM_VP21]|nr:WhiB family transcriptional regulator [Mycobacterium sp. SVM_VP21]
MTAPTRRGRPDTAPPPWMVLLGAILTDVPRLPGRAACRDHVGLFDQAADGDRQAAEDAIEICGRCPVRDRCAENVNRSRLRVIGGGGNQ